MREAIMRAYSHGEGKSYRPMEMLACARNWRKKCEMIISRNKSESKKIKSQRNKQMPNQNQNQLRIANKMTTMEIKMAKT